MNPDLSPIHQANERTERAVREEFGRNRTETATTAQRSREAMDNALKNLGDSLDRRLGAMRETIEARLGKIQEVGCEEARSSSLVVSAFRRKVVSGLRIPPEGGTTNGTLALPTQEILEMPTSASGGWWYRCAEWGIVLDSRPQAHYGTVGGSGMTGAKGATGSEGIRDCTGGSDVFQPSTGGDMYQVSGGTRRRFFRRQS